MIKIQIKGNKITVYNIKRNNEKHSKYKERYGRTNLKKIKTDYNCGFCLT